jgi:GNAT superfamily N-acetyltransferase
MNDANFQFVATLANDVQEAIFAVLRNHNLSQNAAFFSARDLPENASKPLNIVTFDARGTVIGGLIAETQFAWLKVSAMAVAEQSRRRGIGRRLLELAEQEALSRGCHHVYLETMDYQAPEFYRKLDYHLATILRNWDSYGHSKYVFTKEFSGFQASEERLKTDG